MKTYFDKYKSSNTQNQLNHKFLKVYLPLEKPNKKCEKWKIKFDKLEKEIKKNENKIGKN